MNVVSIEPSRSGDADSNIPNDVTVVRVGGQTLLTAKGTVGARVVSPGYAATKAALAHSSGAVTLLLAGQGTKGAATAPPGVKAIPQFVGYGCLVQPWPRTNVHPCGYVIGNSVAQGIFNALSFSAAG